MKYNTKQSTQLAKNETKENEPKNIRQIKPLNLGDHQGFMCDAETGICVP